MGVDTVPIITVLRIPQGHVLVELDQWLRLIVTNITVITIITRWSSTVIIHNSNNN